MREFLQTHLEDKILQVILQRGKSNAIHLEFVQELDDVFAKAEEDDSVDAVLLSGRDGFFSSGLDLITLYQYDQAQMEIFWRAFSGLIHRLAAFSKPFATAISGHAPAGGCVLAIASDYRVMSEGDYIIGLNELAVGIIVPQNIFELYSFWVGKSNAYRYLLEAKLFNPSEALQAGLVDEILPADRIQVAALSYLKKVAAFEKNAWRHTKSNLRKSLLESFDENQDTVLQHVLEQWWKPSTRNIVKSIIDNLASKKS